MGKKNLLDQLGLGLNPLAGLGKLNSMQKTHPWLCTDVIPLDADSPIFLRMPPHRQITSEEYPGGRVDVSQPIWILIFFRLRKKGSFICIIFTMCDRDPRTNPYTTHPFLFLLGPTRASCSGDDESRRQLRAGAKTRPNINFLHSHANQMPPQINNTKCDIKGEVEIKIGVRIGIGVEVEGREPQL